LSAGILSLLFATGASALTLFSPPLVPEGSNVLDCYLVNVSNRASVLVRQDGVGAISALPAE
jgi:hypothetical protein